MLSYSFNQLSVFLEYIVDIEAYTELYCENKDKPETQCNGKCHLALQLAENEEQKQNNDLQAPPEVNLFLGPSKVEFVNAKEFYVEKKTMFYFIANLTEGMGHTTFRPPRKFI